MIIALLTSSAKFFPVTMPYSICLSFSPFKFRCYWLINTRIQFTNLNNHENDINQDFLVFQEEIFFAAKRCVLNSKASFGIHQKNKPTTISSE